MQQVVDRWEAGGGGGGGGTGVLGCVGRDRDVLERREDLSMYSADADADRTPLDMCSESSSLHER